MNLALRLCFFRLIQSKVTIQFELTHFTVKIWVRYPAFSMRVQFHVSIIAWFIKKRMADA